MQSGSGERAFPDYLYLQVFNFKSLYQGKWGYDNSFKKHTDEKSCTFDVMSFHTMSFHDKTDCVWLCTDYYDWCAAAVFADCHKERGDKSPNVAVYGDFRDLRDRFGSGGYVSELDAVRAACHSLPDTGRRTWLYDNWCVYFGSVKTQDWPAGACDAA